MRELITDIKKVLNYIPFVLLTGILLGLSSYATLFGAFITAFLFLISTRRMNVLYSVSFSVCAILHCSCKILENGTPSLYALIMLSGLFVTIYAFVQKFKNINIKIPKTISKAFISGAAGYIILVLIPYILGRRLLSPLVANRPSYPVFMPEINENSIIIAIVCGTIYHYLNKNNVKFIPNVFITVLLGSIINYIYNFNLIGLDVRYELYKIFPQGDFGNTFLLFILSIIVASVIIIQTSYCLKFNNKKALKRFFVIGLSNIISPFLGAISGGAFLVQSKEFIKNKGIYSFIPFVFIILFVLFYEKIVPHVPIVSVATIAALECLRIIKQNIIWQKNTSSIQKIIFALCFLTCLYNIILGTVLCAVVMIVNRKKENDKEN